jgi:hypothetical protein
MSRRPRKNQGTAFKAKVALAADQSVEAGNSDRWSCRRICLPGKAECRRVRLWRNASQDRAAGALESDFLGNAPRLHLVR